MTKVGTSRSVNCVPLAGTSVSYIRSEGVACLFLLFWANEPQTLSFLEEELPGPIYQLWWGVWSLWT